MTQDPGSSGGVGSIFNTWSATVPVVGQVFALLPTLTPWGPTFPMNPAFTNLNPEPSPLLGRADFFQAFAVFFFEDGQNPAFVIAPNGQTA
jgi:hypothetical protein